VSASCNPDRGPPAYHPAMNICQACKSGLRLWFGQRVLRVAAQVLLDIVHDTVIAHICYFIALLSNSHNKAMILEFLLRP
jgi:hypothetical protein